MPARAVLILMLTLVVNATSAARQTSAEINVSTAVSSRTAFVNEPITLQINIENANQAEVPLEVQAEGLQIEFQRTFDRSSSVTSIINGRRTHRETLGVTYEFEVVASKPGDFVIPPFEVVVAGQRYPTARVPIRVDPPQEDNDVRFYVEVDNTEPYVGEPITLRVTLALSRRLYSADDVNLAFPLVKGPFRVIAPRPAGTGRGQRYLQMLGETVPIVSGQSMIEGEVFDTHTGEIQIAPRRAGVIEIGPATARMVLQLERPRSIFDRARTRAVVVPSNELAVRARALPTAGRPERFSGLIGRYAIHAEASPTEVNVGDPINLTITVTGTTPSLAPDDLGLAEQPELAARFRVGREESPPQVVGSSKVYQRILRAISEDSGAIPSLELGYFDVETGAYEVARSEPIELRVRPTKVVTSADAIGGAGLGGGVARSEVEELTGGIRHNFGPGRSLTDQSFRFSVVATSPAGIATLVAPPVAYAAVSVVAVWRRRNESQGAARRQRGALARAQQGIADAGEDAEAIGVAARAYFADVLGRPAEATTFAECAQIAESRLETGLASRIRQALEALDAAAYGGAPAGLSELSRDLAGALAESDRVLRKRGGA